MSRVGWIFLGSWDAGGGVNRCVCVICCLLRSSIGGVGAGRVVQSVHEVVGRKH